VTALDDCLCLMWLSLLDIVVVVVTCPSATDFCVFSCGLCYVAVTVGCYGVVFELLCVVVVVLHH